ncbi:MAG: M1 family metallopeptidase, partial [Flavobacteriales bacterium]|nr:M1 family metallopeptidase [Flavobacteriales bacterium]MBP9079465.1 M1 family metallopeptidase [Flavobacteriales bacterium]
MAYRFDHTPNTPSAFWPLLVGLSCMLVTLPAHAQPYFQQEVDYVIDVRLDDQAHVLRASETFTYRNNSPVTLDTLWIHLWPNAYRDRNTALCKQKDAQNDFDLHFAKPEERGWIDSLDFRSGGSKLTWALDTVHPDIAWIKLNAPLATGDFVRISTPFRVKIPDAQFSRLGHTGQAYYITQWYPKPAVFDDSGWHAMPYLNQGEFYSEFGSFDVSITLPANYVVGATGELEDDPMEEAWMDSLSRAELPKQRSNAFPPSAANTKTLRFKQDKVHDFAWFADKRFLVRTGEVTLPRSGRTVKTQVFFTPQNAGLWKDAITYVNESVRLYSQWVGDYRYSACTAVDGTIAAGGGMEYPMITIIGNMGSPLELDQVIAHEVGHNWFYGMLASNERDHPWMDEGMNSFFEQRYMDTRYPGQLALDIQGLPIKLLPKGQGPSFRMQNELMYRYNARRNWDSPTASASTAFTEADYGTTVYAKFALIFDQLRASLGEALFDSCTHAYFNEWAGKHPQPGDVRASYERTSGKDLGWCFGELIGTADKPDVKARKLKNGELTYRSTAVDGFPFPVTAWNRTDSIGTVWIDGKSGRHTIALPWPNATRIRIDDAARTLDIDRRNNEVRSSGLLKRARLPEIKFLAGLERDDRRSIYWSPAIGYNTHDGFMAGLALHNTTFPSQRFEWALLPMYGFNSNKLAGGWRLEWHNDRNNLLNMPHWGSAFRNLSLAFSGFGASLPSDGGIERSYLRQVSSISIDPRLSPTGPELHVGVRSIQISEFNNGTITAGTVTIPMDTTIQHFYTEGSIGIRQELGFNPYDITLTSLSSDVFSRLSLTAKWSAIYDAHKHRITFRAFAGTFLNKDRQAMRPEMGWRM